MKTNDKTVRLILHVYKTKFKYTFDKVKIFQILSCLINNGTLISNMDLPSTLCTH